MAVAKLKLRAVARDAPAHTHRRLPSSVPHTGLPRLAAFTHTLTIAGLLRLVHVEAHTQLLHAKFRLRRTISPNARPEHNRHPAHNKTLDFSPRPRESGGSQGVGDPLVREGFAISFHEV